jgi:hypothetical protein
MKTIIKFFILVLVVFSFSACFPVMMTHRSEGQGRWNYNNRSYNNGREYRQARRHSGVELRVTTRDRDDRRDNR